MKKKKTPAKTARRPSKNVPIRSGLASSGHDAGDTTDREIVITRLVNAPPELVFKVWTDPKHMVNWWGPIGFTTTMQVMEMCPGGKWEFIMHGPDGTDYQNHYTIHEVVKPKKLVYTHTSGPKFLATITFDKKGTRTLVTMKSVFASAATREKAIKVFHAVEGGKQHLSRLEEYVTQLKKTKSESK